MYNQQVNKVLTRAEKNNFNNKPPYFWIAFLNIWENVLQGFFSGEFMIIIFFKSCSFTVFLTGHTKHESIKCHYAI